MSYERCFFERHRTPCDGHLIRAHLIPRQLLKREYPYGAVLAQNGWRPLKRGEDSYQLKHRPLVDLIEDRRSWVPCCGGPMGNGGHHGMFDTARTLRITREALPVEFVRFCYALGLGWFVEREYGDERRAA